MTSETSIGTGANRHWRNNLILGQSTAPAIFSVTTSTAYSSSDYNGFRPNPGAAYSFQWQCPAARRQLRRDAVRRRRRRWTRCGACRCSRRGRGAERRSRCSPTSSRRSEQYAKASGQDRNSVLVDYDVFVNVPKLDRDPKTVQRLYNFSDLRLSGCGRVRRRSIAASRFRMSTTASRARRRTSARSKPASRCRSTDRGRRSKWKQHS